MTRVLRIKVPISSFLPALPSMNNAVAIEKSREPSISAIARLVSSLLFFVEGMTPNNSADRAGWKKPTRPSVAHPAATPSPRVFQVDGERETIL